MTLNGVIAEFRSFRADYVKVVEDTPEFSAAEM